jgi:hypothetical protein
MGKKKREVFTPCGKSIMLYRVKEERAGINALDQTYHPFQSTRGGVASRDQAIGLPPKQIGISCLDFGNRLTDKGMATNEAYTLW